MRFILIAAVSNNNVIGANNQLLWHMSADLKRFKELTLGHTLIMGRKTFESIGKPLPGRKTIVISRNKDYDAKGCKVVTSLKDAICEVKDQTDVFIAGGGQIYRQVINLHYTKRIYLTHVFANFEGDSFFPSIDPNKWEMIEREDLQPDAKNPYPYAFITYKRRK